MDDGIVRRAYPDNGNGKRKRGRPPGTSNPNGGRKPGTKNKKVIVREILAGECRAVAQTRALELSGRVLDEEARLAFSDIRTLFDENWNLLPPNNLPPEIAAAISSIKITSRLIPQGRDEPPIEMVTYDYSLWDKGRALERLSRHLGLYEQDNKQRSDQRPQINLYLEQGGVQMVVQNQLPGPEVNGYEGE